MPNDAKIAPVTSKLTNTFQMPFGYLSGAFQVPFGYLTLNLFWLSTSDKLKSLNSVEFD